LAQDLNFSKVRNQYKGIQKMRILEKSEDVLTLQASAIGVWFNRIFFLFYGPLFMFFVLLLLWFGKFLVFFLTALMFWLGVEYLWSGGGVVKKCSLNKAFDKVTIEFHGLQAKIRELRFQEILGVEVVTRAASVHGAIIVDYEIWLSTRYGETICLSERHGNKAYLESITGQVREFLSLNSH
jgi:hypothetical protein